MSGNFKVVGEKVMDNGKSQGKHSVMENYCCNSGCSSILPHTLELSGNFTVSV